MRYKPSPADGRAWLNTLHTFDGPMSCFVQPIDECKRRVLGRRDQTHFRWRIGPPALVPVALCYGLALTISPACADNGPSKVKKETSDQTAVVVVQGQITDAVGGGVIGADVQLYREKDWPEGTPIATATTNAVGDFAIRFGKAVQGKCVVVVTKEHFTDLVHRFEAKPGDPPEFIGETLQGDLSLSGHVVDAATGKPLAGVGVRLTSIAVDKTVTTDETGRFTFGTLSPGSAVLAVGAKGFGRERRTLDEVGEVDADLVVELKPQRTVVIEVVDDQGQPIRGVAVEGYDKPRDHYQEVTSDEQGRATLTELHFDTRLLSIRLSRDGYVSDTAFDRGVTLPPDKLTSSHRLVLQRAGSITGAVVSASTGEPVYGARVMTGEGRSDDTPRDWTDTEGAFTIAGVAPGTVTLTVHAADHAPDVRTVAVEPGGEAVVSFKLGEPGQVSGHVTTKAGTPIAGARIGALRWRGVMTLGLRAITDKDGLFTLHDTPLDRFELGVTAQGYGALQTAVEPGVTGEVDFVLEPARRDNPANRPPILKPGDRAPDFSVTTLDGERLTLADFKGKYLLLVFWATWCPPCVDELPYLASLNERYGARDDFAIVSVSRDFEVADLRDFLHRHKAFATWRHVVGSENGVEQTRHAYGVSSIPRLFIIGPDGVIIDRGLRGERLLSRVAGIMKDAGSPATEGKR